MAVSVGASGPFVSVDLEVMAPAITVEAFRAGETGHVVALAEGEAHPALRVARLRDVICVPGGIVITGNRLLGECVPEGRHPHLLRDRAGDWHLHDRGATTATVASRVEDPVLWLDSAGEVSPGSAPMLDTAGRLWAADYAGAFLGLERLRTLASWPAPAFAPRLIEAGGVRARDTAFFDRPILCAQLIVATPAQRIPTYTTPVAGVFWRRIATRLAPPAPEDEVPTRVFLARRAGPERALLAEGRIQAMFARHGFELLDPDEPDIAAIARRMASAKVVAGFGGGGLSSVVLAPRLRAVIALHTKDPAAERLLLEGRAPDIALASCATVPDEGTLARFVAAHMLAG